MKRIRESCKQQTHVQKALRSWKICFPIFLFLSIIMLFSLSSSMTVGATAPVSSGKILFQTQRHGQWELYTINPDGAAEWRADWGRAKMAWDYEIYGTDEVTLREHTDVQGHIRSEGEVSLEYSALVDCCTVSSSGDRVKLVSGTVVGNVTAMGDIELTGGSNVDGDARSGDNVYVEGSTLVFGDAIATGQVEVDAGATVYGDIVEGASIPAFVPVIFPSLDLTAGTEDIQVAEDGYLALSPGDYGDLVVGRRGVLDLSAGTYTFQSVKVYEHASLNFAVGNDSIVVDVVGDLEFKRHVQMSTDIGWRGDDNVLFRVQGEEVKLDKEGAYLGTFYAPNADVELGERAELSGALYGWRVDIKEEAGFSGTRSLDLLNEVFGY